MVKVLPNSHAQIQADKCEITAYEIIYKSPTNT